LELKEGINQNKSDIQQKDLLDNGKFSDLETALKKPESVLELSLREKGYKEFPNEVFLFKNLKKLDLSMNPIEFIPEEIDHLEKLKILVIGNGSLKFISPEISRLKHLENLTLINNSIENVPASICESELGLINLSGNPIERWPDCLCKTKRKLLPPCKKR
jgi:Leucine-rich repeat (LRR) protein